MHIKPGYSLIEIMVVIVIIGILAAGTIGMINNVRSRAKRTSTENILQNLKLNIDLYRTDTGSYPSMLEDLTERPSDEKVSKRWKGPYLERIVDQDAYGYEIVYEPTKSGKNPYTLYSYGPNGEDSAEEDWISVWDL